MLIKNFDRDLLIFKQYRESNRTFADIAKEHGISKTRVQDIYKKQLRGGRQFMYKSEFHRLKNLYGLLKSIADGN